MGTITLLLIDDHQMVREGLKSIFDNDPTFKVIGEGSNGVEGLNFLKNNDVDVILTDINMPVMDGVEFVKALKKKSTKQLVIALSMLGEGQHIKQMLKAGANGYLLKNCGTDELKRAVERVFQGESYFSPEVTEIIMQDLSGKKAGKVVLDVPLSKREIDVLHLITKEYTNHEIADELFISSRTVDAHKRNLLDKTGSKNIAGLVLYAVEKRLFNDL